MNALLSSALSLEVEDHEEELALSKDKPWVLQKLRPRHMEVCSLVAQGEKLVNVAAATGYTPVYISMLMRQPVCVAYVSQLNEAVGMQLEAMFGKAVNVIANAMQNGSVGEQLKAVRLHGELTKRIGAREITPASNEDSTARLARLSERLVGLLERGQSAANGRTIDGTCETVPGETVLRQPDLRLEDSSDEANGYGAGT